MLRKLLQDNGNLPDDPTRAEVLMDARMLIAEILRKSISIPSNEALLAHIDGWDSLKGVRLVLRMEEIMGRELSEGDIETLQSVEDVDRLLKAA